MDSNNDGKIDSQDLHNALEKVSLVHLGEGQDRCSRGRARAPLTKSVVVLCGAQVGAAIDEHEMRELFHASDIDGTGQIDYEEFIAAMLDSNRVARRKEAVRGGADLCGRRVVRRSRRRVLDCVSAPSVTWLRAGAQVL